MSNEEYVREMLANEKVNIERAKEICAAHSPEEGHRVAHCWIGTHFVHGYSIEKR